MKCKRDLILGAVLAALCCAVQAAPKQAWIRDNLRTGVQEAPARNAGFAGTIIAGTPVERLEDSKDGEYVRIRSEGMEGWVLARNVTDTPSLRTRFDEQATALQQAQAQLDSLTRNDQDANAKNEQLRRALANAQADARQAHDDLLSLQRASENVVEIDALNRRLQDRVVRLEQANLELTQQNSRLAEHMQQRQMIIGGLLVLGGMVLFWLLSLASNTRRRSTFSDF